MLETESSTGSPDVKRALELFRVRPPGNKGHPRGNCEGCGLFIWSDGGYRLPGVRGVFCSITCIETALFGQGHCRWCGAAMDKPYILLDLRLCSEDCSANYYAHVLGDNAAALGTGKRFVLWLQKKQPAIYRQLMGSASETDPRYCHNPRCPNGEAGRPASLAHLRAGTLFCSESCKKQTLRSPNGQNREPKTPVFIEFSRGTLRGKAFRVNPGIPAHFEALKGVLR